jgi:hypothetical protein
MEIIRDERSGEEIVIITNEDGTVLSMLKYVYEQMIAAPAITPAFPVTPPTEQTQEGEE